MTMKHTGWPLKIISKNSITHLFKRVSIRCAECGSASTSRSMGSSEATLCSTPGPSLDKMAAASRNCRPSANSSTRRSARRGEVYVFFSLSRSRRIRSRLSFMFVSSSSGRASCPLSFCFDFLKLRLDL